MYHRKVVKPDQKVIAREKENGGNKKELKEEQKEEVKGDTQNLRLLFLLALGVLVLSSLPVTLLIIICIFAIVLSYTKFI